MSRVTDVSAIRDELAKILDDAYEQGRKDMQEFVEQRCKELGIDYIRIFTCEKGS